MVAGSRGWNTGADMTSHVDHCRREGGEVLGYGTLLFESKGKREVQ